MPTQPEVDAVVARALAITSSIVQGEIDPYSGAKRLWRLRDELASLEEALRVFVGMGAEWEDEHGEWHPPHDRRTDVEREIVAAADRFRARFGP